MDAHHLNSSHARLLPCALPFSSRPSSCRPSQAKERVHGLFAKLDHTNTQFVVQLTSIQRYERASNTGGSWPVASTCALVTA